MVSLAQFSAHAILSALVPKNKKGAKALRIASVPLGWLNHTRLASLLTLTGFLA